jgi:hypothetical protein
MQSSQVDFAAAAPAYIERERSGEKTKKGGIKHKEDKKE